MKSLRKSILTLLALTLFGGAGAWAQGPTQVTQFTTGMIASWENDNSDVTLAELQALGFGAVDVSVAQAWTGAPQNDIAILLYGFNEGNLNYIIFDHGNVGQPSQRGYTKIDFYDEVAGDIMWFFTSSPEPAEIELTKAGANQWTLGQAPDYDLELQVEYYEAHALKNIPAGWTVMVNGVDKTAAIDGDSLLITETDSVTLIPDNPRRVKSVTLEDAAPAVQTITVAGVQLNYVEGETWVQTAQRNPGVITIDGSYVNKMNGSYFLMTSSVVSPTSTYDSSLNYWWQEW